MFHQIRKLAECIHCSGKNWVISFWWCLRLLTIAICLLRHAWRSKVCATRIVVVFGGAIKFIRKKFQWVRIETCLGRNTSKVPTLTHWASLDLNVSFVMGCDDCVDVNRRPYGIRLLCRPLESTTFCISWVIVIMFSGDATTGQRATKIEAMWAAVVDNDQYVSTSNAIEEIWN